MVYYSILLGKAWKLQFFTTGNFGFFLRNIFERTDLLYTTIWSQMESRIAVIFLGLLLHFVDSIRRWQRTLALSHFAYRPNLIANCWSNLLSSTSDAYVSVNNTSVRYDLRVIFIIYLFENLILLALWYFLLMLFFTIVILKVFHC